MFRSILVLLALLFAISANATDYNGKNAREVFKKAAEDLDALTQPSNTDDRWDTENPFGGYDSFDMWCEDRLGVLNRAYNSAYRVAERTGDFPRAVTILSQGLKESARVSDPWIEGALTYRTIVRGAILSDLVLLKVANNELNAQKLVRFLDSYYKFVRKVASDLDLPYYNPRNYECRRYDGYCGDFDYINQKRVDLAFAQVQMLHGQSGLASDSGRRGPLPYVTPYTYFKSVEVLATFAAIDLATSYSSYAYACAIRNLREIAVTAKDVTTAIENKRPVNVRAEMNDLYFLIERVAGSCRRY